MTKGLHKDSLRKGEPNKWIVEDIIERIKTEIERLKGICTAQIEANPGQTFPFVMEMTGYDKLLAKLSDLEKEEKSSEGLEEEIQKYMSERWEFGCINPTTPVFLYDFTTDELKGCARHFAKWGAEHLKK